MHEGAKSGGSTRRRETDRAALLDSTTRVAVLTNATNAKDPPPYGAQHRQDALWGAAGNYVLPPQWQEWKVGSGTTIYQDDNLFMVSLNRPLPGVRLDRPDDLIPGCAWHISPQGRSYFVNHNTRATSWTKPIPERPPGSLTPLCIIDSQSNCIWSLACLGTSFNVVSASQDGSIRQWRRDGEPVGSPWRSDGGRVFCIAVSADETMVASASADCRLRLWNVKETSIVGDPWEGQNAPVMCLDWSPDAREIIGGLDDGTIRRWNPDVGQQIGLTIKSGHFFVLAVKYSLQGDKFASGGVDHMIRVWSKEGELLIEIKGHEDSVMSLCWSKDGANIFSASEDRTIRKWWSIDGQEILVLQGHTNSVRSICLTPDGRHLVSAASDYSVRIWDLEINLQVGDPLLHDDHLSALTISSNGRYVASAGLDSKIYIWSLEATLRHGGDQRRSDERRMARATQSRDISVVSRQQGNNKGSAIYGADFWGHGASTASRNSVPSSPPRQPSLSSFLHFSRPANPPQAILLQPRRRNFSLFTRMIPVQTVDVTPARDDNRYDIAPPTEAERAAAMAMAMGDATGNEVNGAAQRGAAAGMTRTAQGTNPAAGIEEPSYEMGCCGFYAHFGRRRST